ncbi:MAG: ATP-binding cassette domain-containing protein, partial [Clostridiales Family XIII bacterium]|jgi:lincosamide and streptogramin A transport system ATP-binding/permease protein|nr:ATP-binding cassette domain-containing protein [Clostridiales Family XIII bacterium]
VNTIDIVDAACPEYEFWELCREMNLLDVDEDVLFRPFNTLSNGEQTKTLMAALFAGHNHFLLLDEPTNHLDQSGKEVVTRYLASKKGFILVSHDRALLDAVTDHTLSINKTNIEVINGGFSVWLENKERRDRFEADENEKLKKDVVRLSEAARRTANWSDRVEATKIGQGPVDRGNIGHKSAKMMKKAKSAQSRREKALNDKSQLLKDVESVGNLKLSPLAYRSEVLAEILDLSITYDDRRLFTDFNMTIKRGARTCLSGGNGSGKSSILKLLVGEEIPHAGTVRKGSGLIISYVQQDASEISGSAKTFADAANIDYTLFLSILINLGFERIQFEKDLSDLSEGQKKKVLIAGSLATSAHLYIWDEPLNYIDIQSRMQIETLLLDYKPTMLFVEHDAVFVEKVATEKVSVISA